MATEGNEWYDSQEKRMGQETILTGVLIGLAFIDGWSIETLIPAATLLLVQHSRNRAVNTEQQGFAERRLFVTNPILVLGSLTLLYSTIVRGVKQTGQTTTFPGDVAAFSVVCILLSLSILVAEHYGNSKYFEWWSKRAENRDKKEGDGFWTWVAVKAKQISPIQRPEGEIERRKKKTRAHQRNISEPFEPLASEYNPPSFKLSYLGTLGRELINWKRLLPIAVGVSFFHVHGFGFWTALAWSMLVWFASSLLADHIKYWYYSRPIRDGVFEEPAIETWKDRFFHEAQSYWTANLLAFVILWLML